MDGLIEEYLEKEKERKKEEIIKTKMEPKISVGEWIEKYIEKREKEIDEILKTKMGFKIFTEGLERNAKQSKKQQDESNIWGGIFDGLANILEYLMEKTKIQDKINETILEKLLKFETKLGELESRIEKIEKLDKKEM